MVIRDIAVFVLDGGSASDSLGFYAAVGIGSEINKAVAAVSPVNVVVVIEYVRIDKHGIALVCNRKLKLAERIFKTLAHFPALRFAVFVKRHIALNAKSPHRLIIIHAEVYRFERRFALLAYPVRGLELFSVHYILIAPVKLLRARVHKSQAYRRRAQDGCRYYNTFFALFLRRAFFPELYKQYKRHQREPDIKHDTRYKRNIFIDKFLLARKFICNQRSCFFEHKADIADERIYRGLSVAAGNQSCAEQQIRYAYCEQCFLKSLSVGNCQSKGEREYYRKACKNLRRLRAALRVRAQYPHTARHRCHYYSCRQHKRQYRHPYFFAVDFLEILFYHLGHTSVVAHVGQRFFDALVLAVAYLGIKFDVV